MNKIFICSIFLLLLISNILANSHSILTPRQITTDPTFELALTDYNIYHPTEYNGHNNCHNYQFYVKPFYQQSTKKQKLASYFLPNNLCSVSVEENGTGDINPLWFGVVGPNGTYYNSTLTLNPVHRAYGAVLTFYMDIGCDWWLLANTALMGASNSMSLCETGSSVGSGVACGFTKMCQALNNPEWCYGRISSKTISKGGLDDIQIKLGKNKYICDNNGHIAPYFVFTIPTGKRSNNQYLFQPVVGSKHLSFGLGLNGEYVYCENSNTYDLSFLWDLKYHYVVRANELRSFDLTVNGDWSRYLPVVTSDQPLNSLPGINYFTQCVVVQPKSTIDFWLAAHYARCNWDIEVGYTLWWRQKEGVSFGCRNPKLGENTGIYDMARVNSQIITSAITATIADSLVNDSVVSDGLFVPISQSYFNLDSGTNPTAITNKIYLSGDYKHDSLCKGLPTLLGLGVSYEFAGKCYPLSQWAVWANIGVNF